MHPPSSGSPLRRALASLLLLAGVVGSGLGLASWKRTSLADAEAAAASQPEPSELVTEAAAVRRTFVPTTTAIGTVRALRSVALQNEVAGTVREVDLETGRIVEAGVLLVGLDVTVEEAELRAQRAEADAAEVLLGRLQRAIETHGASAADVDRAKAQFDVATAHVERIEALIERKRLRAPFRARIGLADVHPGQYLDAGTLLTTLQGVDDALHVDFHVTQAVAATLSVGDVVAVHDVPAPGVAGEGGGHPNGRAATIVAIDARIDSVTRNAQLRARLEWGERPPAPGASVRVRVPAGAALDGTAVPVTALRRGPDGEHVFVLEADDAGVLRAEQRRVVSGPMLGDEVIVVEGLAEDERVAASGSFKLRDGARVAVAGSVDVSAAR